LKETSETSSVIKNSRGNVAVVVVVVIALMSSVVVPVVLGLPVAVPEVSIVVLMASGLI